MDCPDEFETKITVNPWPLTLMGGFFWLMSSLIAVEVLGLFVPPKEWPDVGVFAATLLSALSLTFFIMAIGINIPAVMRDWWKQRDRHLWIALKYIGIYAGGLLAVVAVGVIILVLLENTGRINPLVADFTTVADAANPMTELKLFLRNSIPRFILSLTTMCVLAPLIEEIFFRRFLFVALRKKMNFPLALLISSMLFMVVHPNKALGAIGGIYLGYVYEKGKSLPANILVHAMANFSITILSLVMR